MREPADALEKHLNAFERAVSAAIIPGECAVWCQSTRDAVDEMERCLAENCRHHRDVLDALVKQNVDVLPQVEALRQKDADLWKELSRLGRRLDETAAECLRNDSSEEPIRTTRALQHRLFRWAQNARVLESELVAWFLETTHRDTGAGD